MIDTPRINSTRTDVVVIVSAPSKVFGCLVLAQSSPPSVQDVLSGNCTHKTLRSISNNTDRLLIDAIDYNSTLTFTGIESQTLYTVYCVAQNALGNSDLQS